MTNPPSRSEIESALSGRTRNKTSPKRAKPADKDMNFSEAPRRRLVLGGNLSGVNQRKKFGIFSRYSDVSVANWVAGFVVLLIVTAFFWPQSQSQITEVARQIEENQVVEVDDSGVEQAPTGSSSFARNTDLVRANDFRQQDAVDSEVTQLLQIASEHMRNRRFTQPTDDNAVKIFRKVLTLRPSNADAKEGLSKIKQHFLFRGFNALEGEKPALAKSNLERLALVDERSREYEELSSAIDSYKVSKELEALIKKAQDAAKAGNYILPARGSAVSFYQQVLQVDPENKAAIDGIQAVADEFVDRANKSVLAGELEAATAHVSTIALIDPDNDSIEVLERVISRAKPIANEIRQNQAAATNTRVNNSTSTSARTEPRRTQRIDNTPAVADQTPAVDNSVSASTPKQSPQTVVASSNQKTPSKQADEQEQFDKQYLQQGLSAYYAGEYDKAAALLQPLADKGIARAQMRLAYMHFLGRGFTRSRATADAIVRSALPAIRKFANEGRGWAQSDLGSLYEDGLVLPRDYGEAVYWYRTAAEKGYPGAQTNLGIMYARGLGVTSSRKTAIEWFQRAAKQGDNVAKRNLEAMGVN